MCRYLSVLLSLIFFPSLLLAAGKAPPEIMELARSEIVRFGSDPIIVAAVNAQNTAKISPVEIRKMDEKWRNTPGIAPFMKTLMDSKCGMHLRGIQKKIPFYAEMASASEDFSSQAERLRAEVSFFRLSDSAVSISKPHVHKNTPQQPKPVSLCEDKAEKKADYPPASKYGSVIEMPGNGHDEFERY
ncbi:MAG: hypothetical protein AB7S75_19550 [Desulfococcaceae bacterium]